MSDVPPAWPPHYFSGGWFRMGSDEPQFTVKGKFQFEFHGDGEDDDPALAAAHYAEELPRRIAAEPVWFASGGWRISPGATGAKGSIHWATYVAARAGTEVSGRILFTADPSHWVRVEAFVGAFSVLVAYLDKPWEEFELWPPGATRKPDHPPGRIGKRFTWLNLSATAWPRLSRLAEEDWFRVEAPEN